jgi:hypothetical protein
MGKNQTLLPEMNGNMVEVVPVMCSMCNISTLAVSSLDALKLFLYTLRETW